MTEYTHHVTSDESGTTIVVTRKSDGKTKTFTQVHKNVGEVVSRFMDSLTDDQCLQMFPDGQRRKKK